MKRSLICLALLLIVMMTAPSHGQGRLPQFEIYAGAAIPLSPDWFKDYYQVGFSLHGQYVLFPTPNIGLSITAGYEIFTFNEQAAVDDFESYGYTDVDISGSAGIAEFGVGLRPYLTPPTSNAQLFLFGMGTLNIVKESLEGSFYDPYDDVIWELQPADSETKIGFAVGAGLELPAGNMNIIVQGVTRFILSYGSDPDFEADGETLSFLGITGGIVF